MNNPTPEIDFSTPSAAPHQHHRRIATKHHQPINLGVRAPPKQSRIRGKLHGLKHSPSPRNFLKIASWPCWATKVRLETSPHDHGPESLDRALAGGGKGRTRASRCAEDTAEEWSVQWTDTVDDSGLQWPASSDLQRSVCLQSGSGRHWLPLRNNWARAVAG